MMPPEPPPGSIVTWRVWLHGMTCTYVAVSVAGRGWFVSDSRPDPITWDALCVNAPELWLAVGWAPLYYPISEATP